VHLEVKVSSLYTHNITSESLRPNDVGVIVEVNDCRPPPHAGLLAQQRLCRCSEWSASFSKYLDYLFSPI
jgi:hypothetical protein